MAKSKGKRVRRWLWIGALGLAMAGAGAFALRPRAPREEKDKVKTAKAEVADVQVRVTEVGSVEPDVKVDVKSVLSGKVVELLVREGDRVKRGQVLARVEPDVNQARDLVPGQELGERGGDRAQRGEGHLRAEQGPARAGPALRPGGPRERDALPPVEGQPRLGDGQVPHRRRRAASRSRRPRRAPCSG